MCLRRTTFLGLSFLLGLGGCGPGVPSEPVAEAEAEADERLEEEAARFSGVVRSTTDQVPAEGATGSVWVRLGDREVGLVVWPSTTIVDAVGQPADMDALREGVSLRAWTTTEEYFSIPPMYDAVRIEIDSAPAEDQRQA